MTHDNGPVDSCEHCQLPVYTMHRPRVAPKLVHRGTHLAECHTGDTTAARGIPNPDKETQR